MSANIWRILLLLGVFALQGCSSTSDEVGAVRVHPASWSAAAAYRTADFHGSVVLGAGSDDCRSCHGATLEGQGAVPACTACHDDPLGGHASGWAAPTAHGAAALADFAVCTRCHGNDYRGGLSGVDCAVCHATLGWPHPAGGWMQPGTAEFHGAAAGPAGCGRCHGADGAGGGSGVGCLGCHFDGSGGRVPAGSGWTHGGMDHAAMADYGPVCNACHRLLRSAGLGPASCHDCHAGGNLHPAGADWMDKGRPSFHGLSSLECRNCHGSDYRGGTTGIGCFSCHFDEAGGRVPASSNWQHGSVPHTFGSAEAPVCNACHAISRLYGYGPVNCHDCHVHASGAGWLLPTAHVSAALTDRAACLTCHTLNAPGTGIAPTCRSCHTLSDPPMTAGACTSCHGNPPSSGRHGVSEHRVACRTCHDGYGSGTLGHWYPDPGAPADVRMAADVGIVYSGGRCSGSCHGDGHNDAW